MVADSDADATLGGSRQQCNLSPIKTVALARQGHLRISRARRRPRAGDAKRTAMDFQAVGKGPVAFDLKRDPGGLLIGHGSERLHQAPACVAELALQELANLAGQRIAGDMAVAEMQDRDGPVEAAALQTSKCVLKAGELVTGHWREGLFWGEQRRLRKGGGLHGLDQWLWFRGLRFRFNGGVIGLSRDFNLGNRRSLGWNRNWNSFGGFRILR